MHRARTVASTACAMLVSIATACGHHTGSTTAPTAPIEPPAGPIIWPVHGVGVAEVRAIAVADDGTVYVGGTFTRIGPMTGSGVPVTADAGVPAATFAKVDGLVYAAVADGSGGWYIGGEFAHVGGEPRQNLAHVLADGTVDPAWAPGASGTYPYEPTFGGAVWVLAFDGTTIYAAGPFDTLAGEARAGLGAVDLAGDVTAWAPTIEPAWGVQAIGFRGTTVYLGGGFHAVDGQGRAGLAAVDAAGALTDWNPGTEANGEPGGASAIAVVGDTVFVGGGFDVVAGEPRYRLAALDAVTGAATPWSPAVEWPNGFSGVSSLAADAGTLYVGGQFMEVDGQPRSGLAAFDASGALTAWAPRLDVPMVEALAVSGGVVYVGGPFGHAGGLVRWRLAAFDAAGAPTAWDPDLDDEGLPFALAAGGGAVYVGGDYRWIGKATKRSGLAAIDPSGRVTAWNPGVEGSATREGYTRGFGGAVHALAAVGGTVYVAGEFTRVGGEARANLAAVDAAGAVTAWRADTDGPVYALAPRGDVLHGGGRCARVADAPRANVAAVEPSGAVAAWNPGANALVTSLAASGATLYVGGYFTAVGGLRRTALAAVDAAGAVLPWDPEPSGAIGFATQLDASPPPGVWSVAVDGGTVYVSGDFDRIGTAPRTRLAGLDAASGVATSFEVADIDLVEVIGVLPGSVMAGGALRSDFVEHRQALTTLAFLHADSTASSPAWSSLLVNDQRDSVSDSPYVHALAVRNGVVYVGGRFWGWSGSPSARWGLAAYDQFGNLTGWEPNPLP